MHMKSVLYLFCIILFSIFLSCTSNSKKNKKEKLSETQATAAVADKTTNSAPFVWGGSNVYFLLTDRFYNADTSNDVSYGRTNKTAKLRNFEGGDMKGIISKIKEGYFNKLGVNVIWFTPVVEQIHGSVDEGTGVTYGYHGYWTKDWTAIDPNFGTADDLKNLVDLAHANGIRILMDVVLNHTGPVTQKDPVWPSSWVRTAPPCSFENYSSTVACTLVENLPDIKTESQNHTELPEQLLQKWTEENRLKTEIEELNTFFSSTGLQRTPSNYIIKWLTDYVRELGIDGYRVDTTKHVDETIWKTLSKQAKLAFRSWKTNNPNKVLDANEFYLLGEAYGYKINEDRWYDFGDRKVDYFENGFDNLINFQFKYDANELSYEELFSKYSQKLQNTLKGKSVLNYISSHDDGKPFDQKREQSYDSAIKLLLTPGVSQIYYGDETKRSLIIKDTKGDATLRSNMNWEDLGSKKTQNNLLHWQKLGRFRRDHPAIGAGIHEIIQQEPYTFSRTYKDKNLADAVVVVLDAMKGTKTIKTNQIFADGATVIDRYSGIQAIVKDQQVHLDTQNTIVLLEKKDVH